MQSDEELAEELLANVARIRRQVRRSLNRPAPLADLSLAQMELVRTVRRNPGISVASAAVELGVAANTVSTLVGSLVSAGMLERGSDPADRRSVQLQLTPTAHAIVTKWRDERSAAVAASIRRLDADERRALAAAMAALGRVGDELAELE